MTVTDGAVNAQWPVEIDVLAAIIHSHLEEGYGIDLDDAHELATKLNRLGYRRGSADTQFEARVERLERYAQGMEVSWA